MEKLTFTLKQHTPLIHFQHDQAGATLRATEVKPKLDQFIIKNLFKNDFDSFKSFLIGYSADLENEIKEKFEEGKTTLNYKLKIHSASGTFLKIGYPRRRRNGDIYWDPQIPCFFGNMGISDSLKLKQFVFDKEDIECEFIISDSLLAEQFKNAVKIFCSFFLKNNFGNRQDKGFGSFTIIRFNGSLTNFKIPNCLFFKINKEEILQDSFSQILSFNGYDTEEKIDWLGKYYSLFEAIDLFYRTLRGGINIPGRLYFKSLMFFYAKNLQIEQQWDKKTIRKFFYYEHPNYEEILRNRVEPDGTVQYSPEDDDSDKFLFRDLLGLASEQSWRYYDEDTITKVAFDESGEELQRFKSPITFKPVLQNEGFKIYILLDRIPENYLGSKVEISSLKYGNEEEPLILNIPDSFPLKGYLNWAVKFYQSKKRNISNKAPDHSPEMKTIDDIYNQLYKQITEEQ